MANKVYIMENLGCAHCAGKIEAEVRKLPQVQEAVMVFETKQLRVKTEQPEGLEQTIETIAQSYEPDVTVHDRAAAGQDERAGSAAHSAAPDTRRIGSARITKSTRTGAFCYIDFII